MGDWVCLAMLDAVESTVESDFNSLGISNRNKKSKYFTVSISLSVTNYRK